jgi:hypothetical protein
VLHVSILITRAAALQEPPDHLMALMRGATNFVSMIE